MNTLTRPILQFVLAVMLCVGAAVSLPSAHAAGKRATRAKQPAQPAADPLAQVPPAVRITIQTHLGGGRLDDVTKTNYEGHISYDVTITKAGRERWFTVEANGVLTADQVFLEELPAQVQKPIREQVGTNTITEIYWNKEDGEVVYEVTMRRAGKRVYLSVAGDNSWISLQVFRKELSESLHQALAKELADGKLDEIYRTVRHGEISYEATMTTQAGRARWFTLDANGGLTERQEFLEELPAPAQKTIRELAGSGTITDIYWNKEDGEGVYEVTMKKGGQDLYLSVAADNSWSSLEVLQKELSSAVQTGLAKELAGGKLVDIYKTVQDGATTYDVTFNKGGKEHSLSLDEAGRFAWLELTLDELPQKVQKTIRAQQGDGKIGPIYKYITISYEADIIKGGKKETISLSEDGKLE